jgi:hypothetical protein
MFSAVFIISLYVSTSCNSFFVMDISQCNVFHRYEGEWHRNDPEGHGVVEVEIPVIEPAPGSAYVFLKS